MSFITLDQVCLDYIMQTGTDSIKKTAMYLAKAIFKQNTQPNCYHSSFRALNNINLHLKRGDRVGLIGRNGAGKSTLLRVMAKIYKPNKGSVTINGKISSLFNIMLGLNPEISGYGNIITLGIMRGMSRAQAKNLTLDVAAFTQLDKFLHYPVRTYSTGMQMKLAFAVATSYHSEIVLIDEIIGVGDTSFIERANKRLHDIAHDSHILILASHSNDIIRLFCNKVVVLDQGEIRFFGKVDAGIDLYENKFAN